MSNVRIKAYLSPTLVLLAFDWPDGGSRTDFLGFAVSRTPGFWNEQISWLPNRIGFDGPAPEGKDLPSNINPIQKFLWWDARIDDSDRGRKIRYWAAPVIGTSANNSILKAYSTSVEVRIPLPIQGRIGTYFNRAVVSSQSFARKFGGPLEGRRLDRALAWLANGLDAAIPGFLKEAVKIEGAIYHLTDEKWVIPALARFSKGKVSLVYNWTGRDHENEPAVKRLKYKVDFSQRTRAAIMHNKFLVRFKSGQPSGVLTGSANFTTAGLTTQANLVHTFDSPELAKLYLQRKQLLDDDPEVGFVAGKSGWSRLIQVDEATIRVFFPPEPKGERTSIGAVVRAVKEAKKSVVFCVFTPTDRDLRQAIFEAGDKGLMMFGLVNKISSKGPGDEPLDVAKKAQIELYHRSRKNRDVFSHSLYPKAGQPGGFWWESAQLPGGSSKWPVYIHHKFVVIDAETDHPTIFTGSANMSKNALYRNDENLLEIKDSPRLAAIYLAELLRLYEHYRARAIWNSYMKGKRQTYKLSGDSSWAQKAYTPGTPEYKSRVNMVRN